MAWTTLIEERFATVLRITVNRPQALRTAAKISESA